MAGALLLLLLIAVACLFAAEVPTAVFSKSAPQYDIRVWVVRPVPKRLPTATDLAKDRRWKVLADLQLAAMPANDEELRRLLERENPFYRFPGEFGKYRATVSADDIYTVPLPKHSLSLRIADATRKGLIDAALRKTAPEKRTKLNTFLDKRIAIVEDCEIRTSVGELCINGPVFVQPNKLWMVNCDVPFDNARTTDEAASLAAFDVLIFTVSPLDERRR